MSENKPINYFNHISNIICSIIIMEIFFEKQLKRNKCEGDKPKSRNLPL